MSQSHEFIRFAVETGVLKFGDFQTKAGRMSPYFFNAGLFNDGLSLAKLAGFYADRLLQAEAEEGVAPFDMLFGPAYKGIALASAMAVALAARGRNLPFAFNRKEAKDHGEGGSVIGAPLRGRVMIVDDVISAGTSVGESVALIEAHGAKPAAVLIALDRMERGGDAVQVSGSSAVQQVRERFGLPVYAIATLENLLEFLENSQQREQSHAAHRIRIADYRRRFGS
jgi:orotate phosphoribosyltransferase